MRRGSPSMVAMLGLLAMAGYQNRDKLSGLLKGPSTGRTDDDYPASGSTGGSVIDDLRRMFTGSGGIQGGLTELIERFSNPEQSAKARSWVESGPNKELAPDELEQVLDEETLADLSEKTGLSRADLLTRLSSVLPQAVDELTPEGRLPTTDEARQIY